MLKLQTPVAPELLPVRLTCDNKITVLGSCFADNVGEKLSHAGFDVCCNPFGTLYNPVSLAEAVSRLDSGEPFSEVDCVPMGAGAGLICSFSHHTSFARPTAEQFLAYANERLTLAHEHWRASDRVIITLGTVYAFRHNGRVVSNCLKRPASEFVRAALPLDSVTVTLDRMVCAHPDKEFIFTVSPIRHLADGAHGNQLSKSTLLLAVDKLVGKYPTHCCYFPAYEIVMDELRDYRFYAEDMVHPSAQAVNHIWERFCDAAVAAECRDALLAAEKAWRASQHRQLH